jgi:hypothetical protein
VGQKQSLHQHYTSEVNVHLYLIDFLSYMSVIIYSSLMLLILQDYMLQFRLKLAAVLLLLKNNIANFTVNVQENSDPINLDVCMLVTDNNNDGCEVEQLVKTCRSNNDSDQLLKQNYEIVIGVIILMCLDALF